MSVHPLARTDAGLIQDFVLTKISSLLDRNVDDSEWASEMKAIDKETAEGSSLGHAFLFLYTVSRYCAGVSSANRHTAGNTIPPTAMTPFLTAFHESVANGAQERALELWTTSPFRSEAAVSSPVVQRLASTIIRQVDRSHIVTLSKQSFIELLPDPYGRDDQKHKSDP